MCENYTSMCCTCRHLSVYSEKLQTLVTSKQITLRSFPKSQKIEFFKSFPMMYHKCQISSISKSLKTAEKEKKKEWWLSLEVKHFAICDFWLFWHIIGKLLKSSFICTKDSFEGLFVWKIWGFEVFQNITS